MGEKETPNIVSLSDAIGNFSDKIKTARHDTEWQFEPVTIEQFINDPYYLDFAYDSDTKVGCRPCVMSDLIEFFGTNATDIAPKKRVFIDSEAIGTGKSTKIALICVYAAYKLLCLWNPIESLNKRGCQLKKASTIAITVNARTEQNAKEIAYAKVNSFIMQSEWFQEHYMPAKEITSRIVLDDAPQNRFKFDSTALYKNIQIVPGSSSEYSVLGRDIFIGIIDEITKFESAQDRTMVDESRDQAEIVFSAIQGRIISRFGDLGSIVAGGNPEHKDDFLERHARKEKGKENTQIVLRRSVWDSIFPDFNPDTHPHFYFNRIKQRVVTEKSKNQPGVHACPYGPDNLYYDIAMTSPEIFTRDYLGYPTSAVGQYALDIGLMDRNWNKLYKAKNPMKKGSQPDKPEHYLEEWFKPIHLAWHTLHFDLAETGDAATFCLSHPFGVSKNKSPFIYVDLIYKFQGTPESPFQIRWMKEWVKYLVRLGFPINLITADRHQSVDMLQTFGTYGFMAEYLSVDANRQIIDHLVQCFKETRLNCFPSSDLSGEYKGLERKGDKIVKPRYGSDDVIQAVAGSVWNCLRISEIMIDPPEEGELIGDFDFDIENTETSSVTIL